MDVLSHNDLAGVTGNTEEKTDEMQTNSGGDNTGEHITETGKLCTGRPCWKGEVAEELRRQHNRVRALQKHQSEALATIAQLEQWPIIKEKGVRSDGGGGKHSEEQCGVCGVETEPSLKERWHVRCSKRCEVCGTERCGVCCEKCEVCGMETE